MAKFAKLLVVFSSCVFTIAAGERCCLPGQILTRDEKCKDVATGEKRPISLTCHKRMRTDSDEDDFFINYKGELQFPLPNRIVAYEPGTFCEAISSNGTYTKRVVLICEENYERTIDTDLYGYCMAVSAVFLIVTAAIYATGGLYRDLFGKSVINLCVSLAFGLFILMVMRLMSYSDMNWCAVRGFAAYYFILVSFFWMNAISIQFLAGRNQGESSQSDERRKFALYMVYAWGVPAVFTVVTAIINFMPGDHLKPGIGLNHCWFFDVKQQWEYMYSIMSVLTVVNIVIFATVTALLCCDAQAHSEPFKQKFGNCVRLFIVMGIPWIFEMIGSLAPSHLAWEILDLFNALQGLWIFIVLVVFRSETKPKDIKQYQINIISTEPPYLKLEK